MTDHAQHSAFFVVGTGRCGSTMLRRILRMHRHTYVPDETHWIPILYHTFGHRRVAITELWRVVDDLVMAKGRTALQRIMKQERLDEDAFKQEVSELLAGRGGATIREFMDCFYGLLAEKQGKSIWGDKTPDYGFFMTLLQGIWPDARFIHIYRDGRDVAISMSKVLSFRLQVAWRVNHWHLIGYKRIFMREMERAQGDLPLSAFFELWKSRLMRIRDESARLEQGSLLEVSYETLLKDPGGELDKIAGFLGLPHDSEWLNKACEFIRQDNIHRNRGLALYDTLSREFIEDLAEMGFSERV